MGTANSLRVAVVGATGMVGRILLTQMEKRNFPVKTLLPFSSGRTRDATVRFRGRSLPAPGVCKCELFSADLVFLVSSDEVSKRYGLALAHAGIWVIDDSSAFRLHPGIPLVIPEVNAAQLSPRKRLIAGPNCSVTGAAVIGYPIHLHARVRHIHMASYQAVSGAGRDALAEFYDQARLTSPMLQEPSPFSRLPRKKVQALPHPIAFNVFPQVGSFNAEGDCGEEIKVRNELRKIWSLPSLQIAVTTVRVPVIRGHSLALWIETDRKLTPAQARALLQRTPGVKLWDDGAYPTPAICAGSDPVHVGRIRPGHGTKNELAFWIVSDNLLKGAALNSIQIAELLIAKKWLKPRSAALGRSRLVGL